MAFDINNYKLKYTFESYGRLGHIYNVDIYQKTTRTISTYEIGGVQSVRLQIQGDGDVWQPIVKTSLEIVLTDLPDRNTTTKHYGGWEEFYTPDSTAYLVHLRVDGDDVWWGYITPDSWQESLEYGGSITITARDNLGHLSDFDFDMTGDIDGLVGLDEILTKCWDIADIPMRLDSSYGTNKPYPLDGTIITSAGQTLGTPISEVRVAVSELEDGTYYDALESILASTGMCLRYAYPDIRLCPIRELPMVGFGSRAATAEAEVEFYGGNRELSPAVRTITDKVDYGYSDNAELPYLADGYSTSSNTAQCKCATDDGGYETYNGRYWSVSGSAMTKGGWRNNDGFLNPDQCTADKLLAISDGDNVFAATAILTDKIALSTVRVSKYRLRAYSTDITIKMTMARMVAMTSSTSPYTIAHSGRYPKDAIVRVLYTDPGASTTTQYAWHPATKHRDGTWSAAATYTSDVFTISGIATELADSYELSIALGDITKDASVTLGGYLDVEIYNIVTGGGTPVLTGGTAYGVYARITGVTIAPASGTAMALKTNTVKTINNETYNLKIDRSPAFGALSQSVAMSSPRNYKGALYRAGAYTGLNAPFSYNCNWAQGGESMPLPGLIHKQILCYNQTPMGVLTGTLGLVDKYYAVIPGGVYTYRGRQYILKSATIDFGTEKMESVTLVEFVWYDDLWG